MSVTLACCHSQAILSSLVSSLYLVKHGFGQGINSMIMMMHVLISCHNRTCVFLTLLSGPTILDAAVNYIGIIRFRDGSNIMITEIFILCDLISGPDSAR